MGYNTPQRVCARCYRNNKPNRLRNLFPETGKRTSDREKQRSSIIVPKAPPVVLAEEKEKEKVVVKVSHQHQLDRAQTRSSAKFEEFLTIDVANLSEDFRIWRVEKMALKSWPIEKHGEFHKGDSYVIYCASNNTHGKLELKVFIWIGAESTQDEISVAAIKAAELCRYLGSNAWMFRECQDHESSQFMSIFPFGVKYLDGGIESALKHFSDDDELQPKLFQIKGKRKVRVCQVELIPESLNSGDVFIIDTPTAIFQWSGKESNRWEKAKALEFCISLKEKKKTRVPIIVMEEGSEEAEFLKFLGLAENSKLCVKTAEEGGEDEIIEVSATLDLYKVVEHEDTVELQLLEKDSKGFLSRKMLQSDQVYVLDCSTEVFVWVGKNSSKTARLEVMRLAVLSLDFLNRPEWIPISRMMESGETAVFQQKFRDWNFEDIAKNYAERGKTRRAYKSENESFKVDISTLRAQASEDLIKSEISLAKDGLLVYEVVDTDLVDVSEKNFGTFNQKSSYIIVFSALENTVDEKDEGKSELIMEKRQYVLYWQGKECPKVSILTWKMELAKEICQMLETTSGQAPVTVSVMQGHEPNYFFELFSQSIIIFRDSPQETKEKQLFHVKSTLCTRSVALEVDPLITSLNLGDAFVLRSTFHTYIWTGPACDEFERQAAVNVSQRISGDRQVVQVNDGMESEFWKLLGGSLKDVERDAEAFDIDYSFLPRLFHWTDVLGTLRVEEIYNFTQDDLVSDDVMMLDAKNEIYIWIGRDSRKRKQQLSLKLAKQYLDACCDGRSPNCPIIEIPENNEPWIFTKYFHGWRKKKVFIDPYEKSLEKLRQLGILGRVVE